MTRARYSLVSLDEPSYYHCICRCLRLALLVEVFVIDLCAYAVMSNHYHVVLKVDRGWAVRIDKRGMISG